MRLLGNVFIQQRNLLQILLSWNTLATKVVFVLVSLFRYNTEVNVA